jgi:phage terminase Nu1 subunit (DNA packaging protein)
MKLATNKEFAEIQGVSTQMVTEWKQKGWLALVDVPGKKLPLINVTASQRSIKSYTDIARAGNGKNAKAGAGSLAVGQTLNDDELSQKMKVARVHREEQDAMMAELNLKEKAGELVQAALVDKTITAVASDIRLALERIPTRLSVQLTEMTDRVAIEQLLTQSIDEVLTDLADNIRRQRQDYIEEQASDIDGVGYEAI